MKEKVLEVLSAAMPSVDFECSDKLVTDGIMDSLSVMTLASELMSRFNIQFDFNDITIDNFNSLENITAMVERHLS